MVVDLRAMVSNAHAQVIDRFEQQDMTQSSLIA